MDPPKSGFFSTVFAALLRPWLSSLDRPSLPKYRGEIALRGLQSGVTVRWDSFAVPHVSAANEADLFFTQGYLHAQERLWQMELSRRFLAGRTAEIFGDFALPWKDLSVQFRGRTAVDLDYFVRLLGIQATARASLPLVTDPLRRCLDAYCDGVNRYIEQCGRKPPWEFRLLRHRPEPWLPEDTLTIGKGLAFLLSTALYTRLNFIAVAEKLQGQAGKLASLFPSYPDDAPTAARALWDQSRESWHFFSGLHDIAGWCSPGGGSNAWAIAPARSQSGNATLCNDPHLRMSLPSIWYLMHLKAEPRSPAAEGYEVWGASIPGCPFIQLGRNRQISWGITAAVCDDVEIYRERLHPLEPDRYWAGNQWHKFGIRTESIAVRRSGAREKIIRSTSHGPVISDFSRRTAAHEVLSVRWTAHDPSVEMRSLYGINCAANWEDFQESLRDHAAPSLNFIYADAAGNIGYALAGKIPVRSAAPTLLPLAGWEEENEWRGYIPFEQMPRIFNPPSGFVATANNRVTDSSYPFYLSHFFEPPHRIRRIRQCLRERDKFSAEELAEMQLDVLSSHGRELIGTLKCELASAAATEPSLAQAADELLRWRGDCGAESVAAAIFHVFHHRLLFNLLTPEIGEELFTAYVEILNQCIVPTDRILGDPRSEWFARRSRADLVRVSLREACRELEEALGSVVAEWHWGKVHKLHLNHPFGRLPIFKHLLGIGPVPAAGDGTTINLGFYRYSNPYTQTVGPSLRFVLDAGNPRESGFVLCAGQSGHPFSHHYNDQMPLWLGGRRIALGPDAVSMNSDELLLLPAL